MSGKIKMLFLSSLLLNALLVGVMIGNIMHLAGRKDFMMRDFKTGQVPESGLELPDDKKKLFFETMDKVHRENHRIHRKIRQTRQRVTEILSEPEFNEQAFEEEVKKIRQLRILMMQKLADATKELALQFTQEERRALAEHLKHPPRPPAFQKEFRPQGHSEGPGPGGHPPTHRGPPPFHDDPPPHGGPPPHEGF